MIKVSPGRSSISSMHGQAGSNTKSRSSFSMSHQAFVVPHLDYCSVVWNCCGVTLSKSLERAQNYALRLILCKPPITSSETDRQTWVGLQWTTVEARREIAVLCQVHCTNRAPPYLCSNFTPNFILNYAKTHAHFFRQD